MSKYTVLMKGIGSLLQKGKKTLDEFKRDPRAYANEVRTSAADYIRPQSVGPVRQPTPDAPPRGNYDWMNVGTEGPPRFVPEMSPEELRNFAKQQDYRKYMDEWQQENNLQATQVSDLDRMDSIRALNGELTRLNRERINLDIGWQSQGEIGDKSQFAMRLQENQRQVQMIEDQLNSIIGE